MPTMKRSLSLAAAVVGLVIAVNCGRSGTDDPGTGGGSGGSSGTGGGTAGGPDNTGGGGAGGGDTGGGMGGGGDTGGGGGAAGGGAGGGMAGGADGGMGSGMAADGGWVLVDVKSKADLKGVAFGETGAGNARIPFFVGAGGFCSSLEGTTLKACEFKAKVAGDLTAVSDVRNGQLLAVTDQGQAFVRAEDPAMPRGDLVWQLVASKDTSALRAVAPTGLMVGDKGRAGQFAENPLNGPVVENVTGLEQNTSYRGVSSPGGNGGSAEAIAVGEGGKCARRGGLFGSGFTSEDCGAKVNLNAVASYVTPARPNQPARTAVAVGDKGTILFREGSGTNAKWVAESSGVTEGLYGVFVDGTLGIYAVGEKGTILYRNPTSSKWVQQSSGVTVTLRAGAILGRPITGLRYIVGDQGTVLKGANRLP